MSINGKTIATVVSLVIAFVSAAISYLQFTSGDKEKSISYKVLALQKLLPDNNKSGLKVFSGGVGIDNATFYQVLVKNDGGLPISRADFDSPISFVFTKKAEILYAEVSASNQSSVEGSVYIKDGAIVLEPQLMNVDDSFVISFGVANDESPFLVKGHVLGVKSILLDGGVDPKELLRNFVINAAVVLGMLAFGFFAGCAYHLAKNFSTANRMAIVLLCMVSSEMPLVVLLDQATLFMGYSVNQRILCLVVGLFVGGWAQSMIFKKVSVCPDGQ